MTKSQQMEKTLNNAGINTRRVSVLGSYVHIDTFEKYESKLVDLMTSAGFAVLKISNGVHMDSFDGFRAVFKAR